MFVKRTRQWHYKNEVEKSDTSGKDLLRNTVRCPYPLFSLSHCYDDKKSAFAIHWLLHFWLHSRRSFLFFSSLNISFSSFLTFNILLCFLICWSYLWQRMQCLESLMLSVLNYLTDSHPRLWFNWLIKTTRRGSQWLDQLYTKDFF